MEVTILGSGSASPTLGSHPSAQVVTVGGGHYLIDCGEGTQYRLLEQRIRPGRLKGVFISHLHGDHYFGLFGLLTSLSLNHRREPLLLFGPAGLIEILIEAFRQSDTRLSYHLEFRETDPIRTGRILEGPVVSVDSLPLHHRIPCTGFLFREKSGERNLIKGNLPGHISHEQMRQLKAGRDVADGRGGVLYAVDVYTTPPPPPRAYAFCSDTAFIPELAPLIRGVDLLYHEATFREAERERALETFHSTTVQAATLAREAKVGKLLIGHLSSRYTSTDGSVEEARSIFPESHFAREGETYRVGSEVASPA